MPNRKRWVAHFANRFLLWIEDVPDNQPFTCRGHILPRPEKLSVLLPSEDRVIDVVLTHPDDPFNSPTVATAMKDTLNTFRYGEFSGYAHRLSEIQWEERDISDEEWDRERNHFMEHGQP